VIDRPAHTGATEAIPSQADPSSPPQPRPTFPSPAKPSTAKPTAALLDYLLAVVRGEARDPASRLVKGGLRIASWVYASIVHIRNTAYDRGWRTRHQADCPVISIGNLTVGGTGKSPTVRWVANWLSREGYRVAIVSRGYRGDGHQPNDENRELARQLPEVTLIESPDRHSGCQTAAQQHAAQIVLLDDGFQHRRLARDLDIVLLDATCPFGLDFLLPRGLLRESPRSLRRADVVVITRADQVDQQQLANLRQRVQRLAPHAGWVEASHRPTRLIDQQQQSFPLDQLKHVPAVAVCGIGNPSAFLKTLKQLDVDLLDAVILPDHHAYDADTLVRISDRLEALPQAKLILCTGKDLSKLAVPQIAGRPIRAVEIELELTCGQAALEDHIRSVIAPLPIRPLDPGQAARDLQQNP
jgi:tetraacyldisaccharide 4'-kinase